MPKPIKSYDYSHLLADPKSVDASTVGSCPPIPQITPQDDIPAVTSAPTRDHEPLVTPSHPDILTLEAYWEVGWPSAHPRTLVRTSVAKSLVEVVGFLPDGFGLAILDAWRPLELQQEIYEAAYVDTSLPEGFVNVPSRDPSTPPPHFTGGTVDLTLSWQGLPLALGTHFDDFTSRAHPRAFEDVAGPVRDLRRLLYWSMSSAGFIINSQEWWHFELGTRWWAGLKGQDVWYWGADQPDEPPENNTNEQ